MGPASQRGVDILCIKLRCSVVRATDRFGDLSALFSIPLLLSPFDASIPGPRLHLTTRTSLAFYGMYHDGSRCFTGCLQRSYIHGTKRETLFPLRKCPCGFARELPLFRRTFGRRNSPSLKIYALISPPNRNFREFKQKEGTLILSGA